MSASPTLEELRSEFGRSRMIAMPISGAIAWTVVGVCGALLPQGVAALALFICTGATFPIGVMLGRLLGEDVLGRERGKLSWTICSFLPGGDSWFSIYHPGGTLSAHPAQVPRLPPQPTRLRIRFLTPLRVRHEGRLVRPETFRFADLFGALLRRASMLSYFPTDQPLETDFRQLMDSPVGVRLGSRNLEGRIGIEGVRHDHHR